MANRDLVVIGASAGGIEALQQLLRALPMDLDAAILIVLHTSDHAGSLLPQIMQRASKLPAVHPADRTRIENGKIYIAPPGCHMIVEGSLLRVIQGPRENLHRPAIDPLFRSAASSRGRRVIGIILTGSLDDGTAGLMVVRARGGQAIVQDPEDALFPSMPQSALEQVPDALVLPLREIPKMVVHLVGEIIPDDVSDRLRQPQLIKETKIAELDMSEIENEDRIGHPSAFACPDCGGVLWEIEDDGFLRFRCRVGHAFTARHLGAEQRHAVETALWSALRALEENASLYRRMADRANNSNHDQAAERFEERAANTTTNAHVLREFLLRVNQGEEERFAVEESAAG
jgi:two-component system, chemotaxis family, protein-glutamate methylesterase/glutaminase